MKKIVLSMIIAALAATSVWAQEKVELPARSADRGMSVMKALELRASSRSYSSMELSMQDLSDLLWAARGINRDNGKLTSPTAQNSQDVDIYVAMEGGTYFYDAAAHALVKVSETDLRPAMEGRRPTGAPVCLLIVSDMSKYRGYEPESEHMKHYYEMGAVDSGIVSQSIGIFCAGVGLATVPRAGMDQDTIREKLGLTGTQFAWLNHPVGYPGE